MHMRRSRILRTLLAAPVALVVIATSADAQQAVPQRLNFSTDSTVPSRQEQQPEVRLHGREFVRAQAILGLVAYGPAFAGMVGRSGVTATAGYLVMAGGTFFAAAEIARRVEITEARQLLSTRMAWRGALEGLYISAAAEADEGSIGAAALLGGFGGTAAGLLIGKGLTAGEAMATVFGHDLAFLSAAAVTVAIDDDAVDGAGIGDAARALILTGSGWTGYALGRLYAGSAPYNVTAGDVSALWSGTAVGALAAGSLIYDSAPSGAVGALVTLGGALAGTYAADRLLVRRYDHSRSEGRLLSAGMVAGGLMGIGVGVLVTGENGQSGGVTMGLAAVGGVAGILLTERYLQPRGDEGRLVGMSGLSIDPMGFAAVASGMQGRHSLVRFTF